MRVLSMMAAAPLLIGSLILFFGGIGPLMWFGHFGEGFIPNGHWASFLWGVLAFSYVGAWLGGVGCCLFQWRGLLRAYETSTERPWHWADWILIGGHVGLVLASIHWFIGPIGGLDLFYAMLMIAALGYAVGMGALALTHRSTRDAPPTSGGAPVS